MRKLLLALLLLIGIHSISFGQANPLEAPEFNRLREACGEWMVTLKFHNQPKGQPPVEHRDLRCGISMIMEGRIQEARHSGMVGDKGLEGASFTSFNPETGLYTSTWMDNFGFGIDFTSGTLDTKTGDIVFRGEKKDAKGNILERTREVHHLTEKEYTITMYRTVGSGTEQLDMEVIMVRG
jgi:hypothetical protein